jgi:solute carrier family 25 phosphate transporter 3
VWWGLFGGTAEAGAAMADQQGSLVPSHLYRSSAISLLPRTAALGPSAAAAAPVAAPAALYDPFARFRPYTASKNAARSGVDAASGAGGHFMIPAAVEPSKKIVLYSKEFYTACTIGGMLSCGLTHTGVTPMDVVKCNMQVWKIMSLSSFVFFTAIEAQE